MTTSLTYQSGSTGFRQQHVRIKPRQDYIPRRWGCVCACRSCAVLVAVIVGIVVANSGAGGDDEIPTAEEGTESITVVIQLDDNPAETGWSLECNGTTLIIDVPPET